MSNRNLDKWTNLKESLVDFAHPDLPLDIWHKTQGGSYTLKNDVREAIFNFIGEYPGGDILAATKDPRIVGSITTNQFLDDSDIDVHLTPLDPAAWSEDLVWKVKTWFDNHRVTHNGFVGSHPIEIFIQRNLATDYLSPGFYDINSEKWKKGPKIVPADYDPYEEYSDLADDMKDTVKDADLMLGELKRDVIDFEFIESAISEMSKENKQKFLSKLEGKLKEIEADITELQKHKNNWVMQRRLDKEPATPEEALKDIELSKEWSDSNAMFKLIGRYQYITVINKLRDVLKDDGEVSPEELDTIKGVLGVQDIPAGEQE